LLRDLLVVDDDPKVHDMVAQLLEEKAMTIRRANDGVEALAAVTASPPDAIYLLQENLSEAGYRVIGAASGDEGLQKARELHPLAITLDILMPHKDGWQVLHDLKTDPVTQDIPVIVLTIVDKQALGYQLGAAEYLLKPLNSEALLATLERLSTSKGGQLLRDLLVVDDDPKVHDMVAQLLEEKAMTIRQANDGVEALAAVTASPPDAILLDLMMPRLDGFGVLAHLQQDPAHRAIPVIVLTAKTLTAEEQTKLQQGVVQVVRKEGLAADTLLGELKRALN
jgi:CheY-like chemotaxis protein